MEKKSKIFVIFFLILVILLLAYNFGVFRIIGKSIFDTRAVQQTASVSIFVNSVAEALNLQVPASGNLTFLNEALSSRIPLITNLNSSWIVNATVCTTNEFPSSWGESQLVQAEANRTIRCFEVSIVNVSSTTGNYHIYFNVSNNEMGSTAPENISLFVYNGTGWANLSTFILNGTTRPAAFYGVATHFSKFVIGVKPASGGSSGGEAGGGTSGGGGGSGSGTGGKAEKLEPAQPIKLDREAIKIELVQDSTISEFLKIENGGTTKLKVTIKIEPALNFVSVEDSSHEYSLDIDPLEKRNVEFTFTGKGLAEGIYVTKAIITAGKITKVVPIVIEVVGKEKALFDVDVSIPEKYLSVKPGSSISANVFLYNLGAIGKIGVNIKYKILDLDGNVVEEEEEEEVVETQLQKMKSLKLPLFLKPGKYVFAVEAKYFDGTKERVSLASTIFEVFDKPALEIPGTFGLGLNQPLILFIILILSAISIILLIQFRVLDTLNKIRATNKAEIHDLLNEQDVKEKSNLTNVKSLTINPKMNKSPGRKEEIIPMFSKPSKRKEELTSIIEEIKKRMK